MATSTPRTHERALPTVLIVGETLADGRGLPDLLRRNGYAPLVARSGRHAVDLLKHDHPTAILIAASLPDMTGPEFADHVRGFDAAVPIIMAEPLSNDALIAQLASASAPRARAGGARWPGTVLVVDDEPKLRAALQEFLEGHGLTVGAAASGEEALAQLERLAPSVVLLDVMMPGINGLETLKRIKARRPAAMVIMITGLEEETVMDEALALGAHDYITKPFNLDYLETMLLSKILLGRTP